MLGGACWPLSLHCPRLTVLQSLASSSVHHSRCQVAMTGVAEELRGMVGTLSSSRLPRRTSPTRGPRSVELTPLGAEAGLSPTPAFTGYQVRGMMDGSLQVLLALGGSSRQREVHKG